MSGAHDDPIETAPGGEHIPEGEAQHRNQPAAPAQPDRQQSESEDVDNPHCHAQLPHRQGQQVESVQEHHPLHRVTALQQQSGPGHHRHLHGPFHEGHQRGHRHHPEELAHSQELLQNQGEAAVQDRGD